MASRDRQTAFLVALARQRGVQVQDVSRAELARRAGSAARAAAFSIFAGGEHPTVDLRSFLRDAPPNSGPIVVLDHVTDPHNLGAILRSAYLLGAALVVVAARRGATGGDVVERTSAGAARHVPLCVVPNLRAAIERAKESGWWTYAADMGGEPLAEAVIASPACVVLGAEGKGVSPGVKTVCDGVLSIPMRRDRTAGIDSLNVSVAAGVLLYELARRRDQA